MEELLYSDILITHSTINEELLPTQFVIIDIVLHSIVDLDDLSLKKHLTCTVFITIGFNLVK